MEIILRYREHQSAEKAKIGDKWIEHDRLFTQWDGKPIHPNSPHHTGGAGSRFGGYLKRLFA